MKKIIAQYKEQLKDLLNNKKYIFSIIIVSILAYGYFITHVTIGMDDTCLDRYYGHFFGSNIIAIVGRWGSYALYKILGVVNFTPFWLEVLAVLTFVFTAMIISCFIKKNIHPKNDLVCIIFSCIYISYSLINEPLIFQPSNFALLIGNLFTIISVIAFYEIYNNKSKKINYLFIIIILTIGISMYEACCQTFLVGLVACIIFNLITKKESDKEIFINLVIGIGILIAAIALYYIILNFMFFLGVPNEMADGKQILWLELGIPNGVVVIVKSIIDYTTGNIKYFPVLEFVICTIIGFILSIYYSFKNKNNNIFNLYVIMLFSNLALAILQCSMLLYRACTSWSLFVAIIITVTYYILSKKKYLNNIAIILVTLLILWQTRDLNNWFYSEYVKYQRDLKDAYQIAEDIKKQVDDLSKPIVFVGTPEKGLWTNGQRGAQSNGLSVVWWGQKSFDDNSYELIKFINSLGYNFIKPTDEQYEKGKELAESLKNYPKDGYIKEFKEIIVVKFE